jgi:hypothetical protein
MKKIILICLIVVKSAFVYSQQANAINMGISILPVVSNDTKYVPSESKSLLQTKLTQIVTQNGIGNIGDGRFVITASVTTIDKQVLGAQSPPQILYQLQVNLYVADLVDKNIFATTSITTKGIGINEQKSMMNAISQIQPKNKDIQAFVDEARKKIVDYYNQNCDKIIARAQSNANQRKFQEALQTLNNIPDVCSECFTKGSAAASKIFTAYQDQLCNENLASARTVWAAGLDKESADKAAEYLSNIYPDAKCYSDAQKLVVEIKSRTNELWKFEVKKYQDGVDLEKQRIKAWRDIGVAYGENQPDVVYDVNWIFVR